MSIDTIYTYRAGKKVFLQKKPDQFVVRALPDKLKELGIIDAEQVSSASSRVTTRTADLELMMSNTRNIAPTHHSYSVADTDEEFLITDRIFVTFRRPMAADQVDAFAGHYGLVKKAAYSDRDYLFQLTNHTGMNPVKLVVKLTEQEPLIASADHDLNKRMSTYQFTLPTDPRYLQQWHLHTRLGNAAFDPRASSQCEDAWLLLKNFGAADVVVGVTDDGCKLDHPDFDSPDKFAGWGYFRGERLIIKGDIGANPAEMYKPDADHGTSCAGVIAAEADAVHTVGGAPGCRLFPIQWESSGPSLFISDSKMMTVLDFLADKVDILSNSWGGVPENNWTLQVVNRITALAKTGGRRGRGIVFLWAAGNENCPILHTAPVDVPYDGGWQYQADGSRRWVGVSTARRFENNLAGIPGLMHVAALASNAQRSHYSNYGTGIMICAPTSNVHKYRRLTVTGLGITTATGTTDGVTESFGGTSSATPLVAGIAALTISANPELTALEVVSILKRTTSKDLNFDGYLRTPPASFDPDTSWDVSPISPFDKGDFKDIGSPDGTWSPWFGHGRVDASRAITEALRTRSGITKKVQYGSSPKKDIPDNNSIGIQDVIRVPDAGRLHDIKIDVDITHTYIGDLRVSLKAPDGTTVVLHDKTGAVQDNIKKVYDLATVPAFASLRDKEIIGDWILQVQDLWAADLGRLNSWTMEITITPEPLIAEDLASLRIPDNDPVGITRNLPLPTGKTIQDIAVAVDINHSWIGDLLVSLTTPGNTQIVLHEGKGERIENLVQTWRSQDRLDLRALRGKDAGGIWQLKVADRVSQDEGKLNRWSIEIVV